MVHLGESIRASLGRAYVCLVRCYTRAVFLVNLQERALFRTLPQHTRNVLFVCKGNICRSPLAAAYAEVGASVCGLPITVCSAGLETTPGKEAHPLARQMAEKHGLSLDKHVTKPLAPEMVAQADIIVVMETAHRKALITSYPEAKHKVFNLGHFNGSSPTEIADPYNGTLTDFEHCYEVIRYSCDRLLKRIKRAHQAR